MLGRLYSILRAPDPDGDTPDRFSIEACLQSSEGWTYQDITEGDWGFDRIWRNVVLPAPTPRTATPQLVRVCCHVHTANPNATLFWHQHNSAIAVLGLGVGSYELRTRSSIDGPEVRSITQSNSIVAYEMQPGSWHAVRTHGTYVTITLFALTETRLNDNPALMPTDIGYPGVLSTLLLQASDRVLRMKHAG